MSAKNTIRFSLGIALSLSLAAVPTPAGTSDGTVIGITKILDNGPASDRYNIVLIAEGYRSTELAQFHTDAQSFVDFLLATPPFDRQCGAFNVYRIDVSSTNSGADDPAGAPCNGTGAVVATYFDATFCSDGAIRRLLGANSATATAVANSLIPEWDQVLVIVNSSTYGGSGGSIGVTSVSGTWQNIAVHEFGHSGFGLADEYEYYSGDCSPGGEPTRENHPAVEPVEPNVTVDTNRATVKWGGLILPATAVPTTQNADCTQCDTQSNPVSADTVGLFEGAHYYHCDAYRPQFDCMMRNFGEFCAVCSQRIVTTLNPFRAPNRAPEADAGSDATIECTSPAGTPRMLDGSGSTDADCDALTYSWAAPGVTFNDAAAEKPIGTFPLGTNTVTLEVSDGSASDTDTVDVTVEDTMDPTVHITGPPNGICSAAPVTVTSNSSDVCDASLTTTYSEGNGTYATTDDYHIVVTVTDDSGNFATDSVDFTVDVTPPTVTIIQPASNQLALPPVSIPINVVFNADDNDGAQGGIAREVIKLQGCTIYDGLTYGDRDGLLSDELIQLNKFKLCQFMARCGFTILYEPKIRVEATDACAANTGFAERIIRKRLLKTEVCF